MPESAQAAGDCGLSEGRFAQGSDWVSQCPPGLDRLRNTWVNLNLEIIDPVTGVPSILNNQMFGGDAFVWREAGDNGVIVTELTHRLIGDIPGLGQVILQVGDGDPNGQNQGDLFSSGQIIDTNGDGFASSFFDVFFEIEVPSGERWRNSTALTIYGDRPLLGVPPNVIMPAEPNSAPNDILIPPLVCIEVPPVAINYCGTGVPTSFFSAGDDGEFGTPDDILRGRILAETHTIHPRTPEPSALLALMGLGAMLGWTKKRRALK